MNIMRTKTAAAAVLAVLLLTAGCGNPGTENNSGADSADSPAAAGTAQPESSQESNNGQTAVSGGIQAEALIALNWQRTGAVPAVEAVSGLPAGAAVISSRPVEQLNGVPVQVTFYTKSGDEDYVYADISTSMDHFSLGSIGTYNYRKPEELTAEAVSLFTDRMLKITGGLGANSSLSSYYTIDDRGAPAGILKVDTGHTRELDADGDGWPEAVSAHGTPMTAYIYRWHNGQVEEAFLNDVLQADSVMLRDDLIFEASDAWEPDIREYRLSPDGMIPLQPSDR